MNEHKPAVSIFYPCYNDWGTIASMVLMTKRTAESLGLDYDITLVDDGSSSHTQELLETLEQVVPDVNIIRHEQNRGYGGALRSGFAAATKEWVFYTDGDAQYDVRELALLVEHAGPDTDLVQGYKMQRHDPLHRVVIGKLYHWFVRFAFMVPVRDTDCDFRLMRKSMVDELGFRSDTGVICVEMMRKIGCGGYRIVEVPVHHYQRAHGKSQFFNFPRLCRVALRLAQLWYREVLLDVLRKNES